jgi:hypothetical protein
LHHCFLPFFVIPGRAESASPESITTIFYSSAPALVRQRSWLWSRLLFVLRRNGVKMDEVAVLRNGTAFR